MLKEFLDRLWQEGKPDIHSLVRTDGTEEVFSSKTLHVLPAPAKLPERDRLQCTTLKGFVDLVLELDAADKLSEGCNIRCKADSATLFDGPRGTYQQIFPLVEVSSPYVTQSNLPGIKLSHQGASFSFRLDQARAKLISLFYRGADLDNLLDVLREGVMSEATEVVENGDLSISVNAQASGGLRAWKRIANPLQLQPRWSFPELESVIPEASFFVTFDNDDQIVELTCLDAGAWNSATARLVQAFLLDLFGDRPRPVVVC